MKVKQLFAAALLFCSAGAWAQTDVTTTYLTNADFETDEALTSTYLYGYGKDGSPYGFQTITGWTSVVLKDASDGGYAGSAIAAGTFSYGSATQLKGNAKAAPATNPDGEATGQCFGFFGVWGCGGYYYQTVTLAAGKYTITVPMYNQSGTQANTTYTGFFPTSGTNRTVAVNPTVGQWVNQTVTFTLADDTEGQIRIGYQSTGSGSGANPMLFIDCVKIEFTAIVVKDVLETAISAANNANASLGTLNDAIATAQAVYDNDNATQDEVNSAAATLNAAVELAMSAAGDASFLIPNLGFESCTETTTNAAATDSAAPLDIAGNWTQTNSAAWSSSAVVSYGGDGQVNGVNAPATDNAGNTGNALGVSVGWGGTVTYKSATATLPAGVYTIKVNAYNALSGVTQFKSLFGFVSTSGSTILSTKTSFTYGTWETDQVTFTLNEATEGYIQVGGQAISGGSGSNAKVFFDNITIGYQSFLAGAKAAWDEVHDALEALNATALPDAAEAAITDELGKTEPTSVDGYNSAKDALQALIDSYDGIKAAYDKVKDLLALATAEKTNSTGDKTNFETAINDATTTIETRTDASNLANDYTTLEEARQAYVTGGAQPTEGKVFDYTFKIADAAVTGTGWSAAGTASGQQYTDAPDNRYFDCGWNSTLNKSQKVESLPAGYYMLKAATRAKASEITDANVYVNQENSALNKSTDNHRDGSTGGELGNGWGWTEVDFEVHATGDVTIGFYAKTTGQGWAGADDYHLYFKGNAVDDETAAALKATVVSDKMNSTIAAEQTAALNAFESEQTMENYGALEEAIAAANASKNAYIAANEKLTAMKAIIDATNVYTAEALDTYYTTPKSKYEDNSLTDEEAEALQNPSTQTDWHAAITVDNFLLSAWNSAPNFDGENSPYYINTWSTEGNTDGSGMTTPFFEYYVDYTAEGKLAERTLTATVTGVTPGVYSVDVLVRISKNAGEETTVSGITLDINGGEATDLCTGEKDANARFYGTFRAIGTVGEDGVLNININVAEDNNAHWLAFKNVKYAVFTGATTEQKNALANAITNAESKTLGFSKDEYAPYNNIEVLAALDAAKTLDTEIASAAEVTAATAAIEDENWAINATDVDAIYNGTFAKTGTGNNPKGWSRSNNGWGQQITGLTAEANGVAEGTTTAWYYNTNGAWEYGKEGAYTMPLAENQTYKLSFKYSKHGNDWQNWMKASVINGDNEALPITEFAAAENGTNFVTAEAYFTTGAAGNYILSIEQNGNAHLTDVCLVKVASAALALNEGTTFEPINRTYYETVTMTRKVVAGYNTVCLPFDLDAEQVAYAFGENAKVYTYSETCDDADNVTINFSTKADNTIQANVPVLIGDATASTGAKTFSAVMFKSFTGNYPVVSGNNFDFVGTYADITAIAAGDYFIGNGAIYRSAGETTIKAFRAYIHEKTGEGQEVKFLVNGEEFNLPTAISEMNDNATENGTVYNLAGQRVNKAQKGLYIVNGKKVIIK